MLLAGGMCTTFKFTNAANSPSVSSTSVSVPEEFPVPEISNRFCRISIAEVGVATGDLAATPPVGVTGGVRGLSSAMSVWGLFPFSAGWTLSVAPEEPVPLEPLEMSPRPPASETLWASVLGELVLSAGRTCSDEELRSGIPRALGGV